MKLKKAASRGLTTVGMAIAIIIGGTSTIKEASKITLSDYSDNVSSTIEQVQLEIVDGYINNIESQERLNNILYVNNSLAEYTASFKSIHDNRCIANFKKYSIEVNGSIFEIGEGVSIPEIGIERNWAVEEMLNNISRNKEASVKEEIISSILQENLIASLSVLLLIIFGSGLLMYAMRVSNALEIGLENAVIVCIAATIVAVVL